MISLDDIRDAMGRVRPFVHKTPLIYSNSFSRLTGAEVYLKVESLQKTGSFKVRGAVNKMLGMQENKVIAASMGNHAQGVAFAAGKLGKDAVIVMPTTAPIVKQEASKGYGAEVVLHGSSFDEALDYALSRSDRSFIHAFDDDEIMAGQGTVGIEIAEDMKGPDILFIPVGGGGLIAGVSLALKSLSPGTRIIGVQARAAVSAYLSFTEGKISTSPPLSTLADGIAVGKVGEKTFEVIRRYVDEMVLVDEDSIAMAILLFLERKKLVVEGAGAAPLSALLQDPLRYRGKKVVLVVSGGNIDFTLIDRIIRKGLVKSGRIGVFEVTVEDVPGTLSSVTGIIAEHRGNIMGVSHDRLAVETPLGKTRVAFTVETRGSGHLDEIIADMTARGFEVGKKG
ncbi:MAG: threonine ammonia-lyase [Candidatus Sulfobium sp.]